MATILIGAFLYGQQSAAVSGMQGRAMLLADEGVEALHNMHDQSFANLTNGTFGLAVSGGQWILSGTSDSSGVFTREVVISHVSAHEKQVVVTISWQAKPGDTRSISRTTRLTNWQSSWARPSQIASLNLAGAQDGLKIRVQNGYAYLLRNGSSPDFIVFDVSDPENPTQVGALTLSGTLLDLYVAGSFAYVASADNAGELKIINISNPTSPIRHRERR
jgi:hypothetical protein